MPAPNGELTLNDVRQEFPGWICWRGAGHLLYARHGLLPLGRYDVWGADPVDLQDAIICFLRMQERDSPAAAPGHRMCAGAHEDPR